MRIFRRLTNYQLIFFLIATTSLLVGIAFVVLNNGGGNTSPQKQANDTINPSNTVDYGPSQANDNLANDERKDNPGSASPTLNYGSTRDDTNASGATITVTRAGRSGNSLQVGTLISGATSGTCKLLLSQDGQTDIERSAAVAYEANSYTCPIFNIPVTELPNQGKWDVSVSLTVGSSTTKGSWAANPVDLSR
jgi:hypothetical protein